jgi:ABC-type transport system involved in multi-copper enzyme maturation permease subunit
MATTDLNSGDISVTSQRSGVPPDLRDSSQFKVAFRYQVLTVLRSWRFVAVLALGFAVAAAYLGIDWSGGLPSTASGFLANYIVFVRIVIVLGAVLVAGDAVSMDFASPAGFSTLALPVRREVLLGGRFLADVLLVGIAVGVYYAFAGVAAFVLFSNVPVVLLASFGIAILYVAAVVALTFLLSSIFRSPTVSIVATFLLLIVVSPGASIAASYAGVEPWFTLYYGFDVAGSIFLSSTPHVTLANGHDSFSPYLGEGITIMFGYLVALLGADLAIYRSKEVSA